VFDSFWWQLEGGSVAMIILRTQAESFSLVYASYYASNLLEKGLPTLEP
jgi:hypothetical protein